MNQLKRLWREHPSGHEHGVAPPLLLQAGAETAPPLLAVCAMAVHLRERCGQKQAHLGPEFCLRAVLRSWAVSPRGDHPECGDRLLPLLSPQSFCAALHQELKEYYRLLSVLHSQVSPCFYFIMI